MDAKVCNKITFNLSQFSQVFKSPKYFHFLPFTSLTQEFMLILCLVHVDPPPWNHHLGQFRRQSLIHVPGGLRVSEFDNTILLDKVRQPLHVLQLTAQGVPAHCPADQTRVHVDVEDLQEAPHGVATLLAVFGPHRLVPLHHCHYVLQRHIPGLRQVHVTVAESRKMQYPWVYIIPNISGAGLTYFKVQI